ncbi:ABC transporter ATP-binding protein [Fodinicola feengrottensis]|uniref:ABC transporter ATP-binding protein n=1 Tax=Fodinicola feengrottensis TaxID=435914 RepID=UPI0024418524|nr:ATP-binding cassette domain-containing protein [Fodinicola feengrottensis]
MASGSLMAGLPGVASGGARDRGQRGLHKEFRGLRGGRRVALHDMNMLVEAGTVHGFLGPNGAGKTTTIRSLLGLIRPDAGEMNIFGHEVPRDLRSVIQNIGTVVEGAQFFGNFSARRNLRMLATLAKVRSTRVDEVLELVGLRDRAGDKVKGFSLGMRQRLAIGATLLKEPLLLILDEPNNGLDPAGIREIRDLMRALGDGGVTVLLSSHQQLLEVQQVCDSVSIVAHGRHVVTGPVSDVLATAARGEVLVRVDEPQTAAGLLRDAGMTVTTRPDHLIVTDVDDPARITQLLARRRLYVSELTPLEPDLEDVFFWSSPAPRRVPPRPRASWPGATRVCPAMPPSMPPLRRCLAGTRRRTNPSR